MKRKYFIWIGIIALLVTSYFIADSILFTGVKARVINEDGIQANYFAKSDTKDNAAIILVGGGQWGDYWGQEFVKMGWTGLSLPYVGREGLPDLPEEIDLAYFENALNWLKKRPEVDPKKIVIVGASRNAELALVIAATFPNHVSGVVAYAPSAVSWSNTVLPYNADDIKASWTYQGADIPYVPMDKAKGGAANKIETLKYWKNGLAKVDEVSQAAIKVEQINGPILLFSGTDDKVWPSSLMADMIEQRINENNFNHSFQNIKYEDAGHLISGHPDVNSDIRTGTMHISGEDYEYEFGGSMEGDRQAKKDAKMRLIAFIDQL